MWIKIEILFEIKCYYETNSLYCPLGETSSGVWLVSLTDYAVDHITQQNHVKSVQWYNIDGGLV